MASLSPWEHMGIGAAAGMTEVLVMQPTVGVKNALQEGRPIPWGQPTQLYRGLVVSSCLVAAINRSDYCVIRKITAVASRRSAGKLEEVLLALQINCTSFAPITAIQFGTNRLLEGALNAAGYEATGWSRVAVAAGAHACKLRPLLPKLLLHSGCMTRVCCQACLPVQG